MSFKTWKKIELLDLADKLDLHASQASTKAVIANAIDKHLRQLDGPLDLNEFPELATYYEDAERVALEAEAAHSDASETSAVSDGTTSEGTSDGTSDDTSEGTSSEDESEPGHKMPRGTPFQNWFSQLDFSRVTPARGSFAFKFNEFLQDVQSRTIEANENVQDALSTIPAVDVVFLAIEAYVYVISKHLEFSAASPFVAIGSSWREVSALLGFWSVWSLITPALVGYYINFIRYDLPDVPVDPMVFHISKALFALLLAQWQPSFSDEAAYAVKDVAGSATFMDSVAHWSRFALAEWKQQLGLLPFILGCAGSALCLYVL